MSGLALFGGTFDPIHNGHLAVARAAAEHLALERILFIPAGQPPHRSSGTHATYAQRYQMVALACQADERFAPSRLEEGADPSYSIDTVQRVRMAPHPEPLYFLIGADAFAEIETWHRWQDLLRSVVFLVMSRPGAFYQTPPGAQVEPMEEVQSAISSSEVRRRLAEGDPDVPVPAAVVQYIHEHRLYRRSGATV